MVFGFLISESFGTNRNHYDRFVHLASGVLLTPAIAEALNRYARISHTMSAISAVAWVMTIGAIYEIFEWQLAITMSPQMAESYNGQQGDVNLPGEPY
jgi:putative membrane protein